MVVRALQRVVPRGRIVLLLAHAGEHPRFQRLRAVLHPVSHVVQSGTANGAITAYGWRGVVVVPVVVAVSMLLTRLQGRRGLAEPHTGAMDALTTFGWVALIVIPIVLAVSVTLAVLLARNDADD